jgi:hypothetical protein
MGIFGNDKERRQALEAFAKQKGYAFEAKDSYGIRAFFKDMKLFKHGAPKSLNVIQRREEAFDYSGVFDYHYTVSTGKSSHTYKQTVYFRIHNDLMLPDFRLFPEKWFHQVQKWFGMQDINFVSYPEFSQNFVLQGQQPDFIWKLFQYQKLVEFFNVNRSWSVEAVGKFFVMYQPTILQPAKEMQKFLKTGDALYDLLVQRNKELEEVLKGQGDEV